MRGFSLIILLIVLVIVALLYVRRNEKVIDTVEEEKEKKIEYMERRIDQYQKAINRHATEAEKEEKKMLEE
jgi:energy-converting hydrogenase Eha subunit H